MTGARRPPAIIDVFDWRRLREARQERGLSEADVCRHVTKHYNEIERGTKLPSITVFAELCQYLELDPFTIALILRQPCVPPSRWLRLRAKGKQIGKSLTKITQEFLDVLYREGDSP